VARLEFIQFTSWQEEVRENAVVWEPDPLSIGHSRLPQVFWDTGETWAEANHWALTRQRAVGADPQTAKALTKHLRAYACFLEDQQIDWRTLLHREVAACLGDGQVAGEVLEERVLAQRSPSAGIPMNAGGGRRRPARV
jgi:hypothetical protein